MERKRILIVDDEPHIRHVLALKLEKAGMDVILATDGEEALDLCRSEKPDLVITDFQMPYLSGVELCQQLRREPATQDIPAIMLTARGFDLDESETAQSIIVAVMSKPFSPAEVLAKANELLNRSPEVHEVS